MSTRLRPSVSPKLLWLACLDGREPAESLSAELRERLVALLLDRGWPVAVIAEHTFMTTYTTGRICDRIKLRQLERRRTG
jgi:hypothetical protein